MTAREQAREAARRECDRLGSEHMAASAEHYANVASDVWQAKMEAVLGYIWHDDFPTLAVVEDMLQEALG